MCCNNHGEGGVLSMTLVKIKNSMYCGILRAKSACHILFNVKIEEGKQRNILGLTRSGRRWNPFVVYISTHTHTNIHIFWSLGRAYSIEWFGPIFWTCEFIIFWKYPHFGLKFIVDAHGSQKRKSWPLLRTSAPLLHDAGPWWQRSGATVPQPVGEIWTRV